MNEEMYFIKIMLNKEENTSLEEYYKCMHGEDETKEQFYVRVLMVGLDYLL